MTPTFRNPRFSHVAFEDDYNSADVDAVVFVRECRVPTTASTAKEQNALCRLLRNRGLVLGVDVQTTVHDKKLYAKKLTAKKLG